MVIGVGWSFGSGVAVRGHLMPPPSPQELQRGSSAKPDEPPVMSRKTENTGIHYQMRRISFPSLQQKRAHSYFTSGRAACATALQRHCISPLSPSRDGRNHQKFRAQSVLTFTKSKLRPRSCSIYIQFSSIYGFAHLSVLCRTKLSTVLPSFNADRGLGNASVDQLASPLKRGIESPISLAL